MKDKKPNFLYRHIFSKFEKVIYLSKKAIYFAWYRHHFLIPPRVLIKYIRSFFVALKRGNTTSNLFTNQASYIKWFNEQNKITKYKKFKYRPLISFIIPTYNVSRELLSECLNSILNQSYDNFEVCIADDNSTLEETKETLREYMKKDKRIKVTFRDKNGMISEASNTAINLAKGEFIALVDNDDTIEKDSLYYIVEVLNKDKTIDMIYSDEDKIDFKGKYMEPHFKPDWSPDTLMGVNYICHLCCLRKSIVDKVGGFRSEFDGSQDYDLFLRFTEKTSKIYHIEKVLYHWRQTPTSTAGYLGNKSYAYIAGKKALEDALKRRKLEGEVFENPRVSTYLIKYGNNNELVSIIIPIKDKATITRKCIDSIYEKSTYKNFEIILVDNNSCEKETQIMIDEYKEKYDNFKSIRLECEYNYAYINNMGVKEASGEYILLLNNDTEVLSEDFIEYMLGYARLNHIGCVGIKLLYPDKLVQHAGVVLGFGGVAGHIYVANNYYDNGLFGRLVMPYNYTAVTAACLMINKNKFNEVNGFDEKLKVALNDVDLNLKLLDKGYFNVCLSNVEMIHYESKSRGYEASNEKHQRFLKEQEYMKQKWGKTLEKDKYFSKNNF
ncbi:MAG: glycosyltransferase family 2 protein [Bacilli bacterium]|nr:glycosyltransferase family 2 protein [Bacilli bacterium]